MKIVYTGLRGDTLEFIQKNSSFPVADFISVNEEEILSGWNAGDPADIFLIGENADNPLQIAQKIYGHDSDISVLIINNPLNYQKIKQALIFTPFIGPTVHAVSSAAGKGLGAVVSDHVQRSRQRRNYKKFQKSVAVVPLPSSQKVARVKEDFLNRVLAEAPIGLVLLNGNGTILSFNRYASALFRKSEREVLGSKLTGLFPEPVREGLSIFLNEIPEENLQKTLEIPGEEKPFFLELILSKVEKDDPSYKIVLIKNVTDQVLVQKSIEENAQKVRMIVDSMPEMAWTALPTGELDYFNKRWYKFTGQSAGDSGNGWEKAVHPEDLPEVKARWKSALADGGMFQTECRYLRGKDKVYCWHLTRALPVRDQDGKILHWVGTCTDIQSLKNTEEQLQKIAEELAASNEELTAANEEITASMEELNETNDRLIQVNSDLDNFIYTASHDLKAPITNIEGLINILGGKIKKENQNEQVPAILGMIDTSIQRFKRTIGDLTEIVKLQRLSDLEPQQTNVCEVINEVKLDLHHQIREANAEVEISTEENAVISFSRKNFKSIVYNLLSNAIKYRSAERKLHVKISFFKEDDSHILRVEDNGLGMDLKDEEKIFGMFRRMHSHVEGSGIGLYIVRKIVENSGGSIGVESQPDAGSVFKINIPDHIRTNKKRLSYQ